jgi:hypothetical protein
VCYHLGEDVEPKNLSVKFTLIGFSKKKNCYAHSQRLISGV